MHSHSDTSQSLWKRSWSQEEKDGCQVEPLKIENLSAIADQDGNEG